jgi:Asp-tRNA(Asn)/Glu-tRNA(Gln) amidotransferase A subunit family amidase
MGLPIGLAPEDGLPVGLQLMTPARADARLYTIGAALEQLDRLLVIHQCVLRHQTAPSSLANISV